MEAATTALPPLTRQKSNPILPLEEGKKDGRRHYHGLACGLFLVSHPVRRACINIIDSNFFNGFILTTIIVNCVFLALDDGDENSKTSEIGDIADYIFTAIFTVEMLLRMTAQGLYSCGRHSYFKDNFNCLDFAIVLMSYIQFLFSGANFTYLRAIRIVKPLRVIKALQGLRTLTTALGEAITGLINVLIFFSFCLFVFGILGMQVFGGRLGNRCVQSSGSVTIFLQDRACWPNSALDAYSCGDGEVCEHYGQNPFYGVLSFDNILVAWLNILQVTSLEGWVEVMNYCSDGVSTTISTIYFVSIVMIMALFVRNLILAVIFIKFNNEKNKAKEQETQNDEHLLKQFAQLNTTENNKHLLEYFSHFNSTTALARLGGGKKDRRTLRVRSVSGSKLFRNDSTPMAFLKPKKRRRSKAKGSRTRRGRRSRMESSDTRTSAGDSVLNGESMIALPEERDSVVAEGKLINVPKPVDESNTSLNKRHRRLQELPSLEHPSMQELPALEQSAKIINESQLGLSESIAENKLDETKGLEGKRDTSGSMEREIVKENVDIDSKIAKQISEEPDLELCEDTIEDHNEAIMSRSNPVLRRIVNPKAHVNLAIGHRRCSLAAYSGSIERIELVDLKHLPEPEEVSKSSMKDQPRRELSDFKLKDAASAIEDNREDSDSSYDSYDEAYDMCGFIADSACYQREWCCFNCCPCWRTHVEVRLNWFVRTSAFQGWISLAIIANMIFLSLDHYEMPTDLADFLYYSNIILTVVFALEMACMLIGLGWKEYCSDRMNLFDAVVVIVSIIELFLESSNGLSALRCFRLLRLLKLFRNWPDLRAKVDALFNSLEELTYFVGLLFLFMFIYAILGVQLFRTRYELDGEVQRPNFDNFLWALLTVFQISTGENWNEVLVTGIRVAGWGASIYFVTLQVFGSILLDLFLAILLTNLMLSNKTLQEEQTGPTFTELMIAALLCRFRVEDSDRKRNTDTDQKHDGDEKNYSMFEDDSTSVVVPYPSNSSFPRTNSDKKITPTCSAVKHLLEEKSTHIATHQPGVPIPADNAVTLGKVATSAINDCNGSDCHTPRRQAFERPAKLKENRPHSRAASHSPSTRHGTYQGQSGSPRAWMHASKGSLVASPLASPVPNLAKVNESKKMQSKDYKSRSQAMSLDHNPLPRRSLSKRSLHRSQQLKKIGSKRSITQGSFRKKKEKSKSKSTRRSQSAWGAFRQISKFVTRSKTGKLKRSTSKIFAWTTRRRKSRASWRKGGPNDPYSSFYEAKKEVLINPTLPAATYTKRGGVTKEMTLVGYSFYIFGPEHPLRAWIYDLVKHEAFGIVVLGLIFISCLLLTLDSPKLDPNSKLAEVLFIADLILTILFTIEMLLKCIAYSCFSSSSTIIPLRGSNSELRRSVTSSLAFDPNVQLPTMGTSMYFYNADDVQEEVQCAYFSTGWNQIDAFVVLISILNLFSGSLAFFKAFRAVRSLRALRAVSRSEATKLVVKTIMKTILRLHNILLITLLIFIIFAVIGVQFFQGRLRLCLDDVGSQLPALNFDECLAAGYRWDNPKRRHFDNVGSAMLLLFEVASLEQWPDIMFEVIDATPPNQPPERDHNPAASLFFVSFLLFGSFLIVSMFVGAVVSVYQDESDKINSVDDQKKSKNKKFDRDFDDLRRLWLEVWKIMVEVRPAYVMVPPQEGGWRTNLFNIVQSETFEFSIMGIICVNVLLLAMQYEGADQQYLTVLEILNLTCTCIFFLELVTKVVALGFKQYIRSRWNRFDAFLVAISVVTLTISSTINPTAIRTFRILRIFRLLPKWKGLRQIVRTLMFSLPALYNILFLLALTIFIYAVMGMSLFGKVRHGEYLDSRSNFEDFPHAVITLFGVTTGEGWNGLMHDCMVQPPECTEGEDCGSIPLALLFFVTFMLFAFYSMLNLIVAVVLKNFESEEGKAGTASAGFWGLSPIKPSDIERYSDMWSKVFPNERYINVKDLGRWVVHLQFVEPQRYTITVQGKKEEEVRHFPFKISRREMSSLNIPVVDNKVHYLSVLQRIALRKFCQTYASMHKRKSEEAKEKKIAAPPPIVRTIEKTFFRGFSRDNQTLNLVNSSAMTEYPELSKLKNFRFLTNQWFATIKVQRWWMARKRSRGEEVRVRLVPEAPAPPHENAPLFQGCCGAPEVALSPKQESRTNCSIRRSRLVPMEEKEKSDSVLAKDVKEKVSDEEVSKEEEVSNLKRASKAEKISKKDEDSKEENIKKEVSKEDVSKKEEEVRKNEEVSKKEEVRKKEDDSKEDDGMESDGKESDAKESDGKEKSDGKESDNKEKSDDKETSDGMKSDSKESDVEKNNFTKIEIDGGANDMETDDSKDDKAKRADKQNS